MLAQIDFPAPHFTQYSGVENHGNFPPILGYFGLFKTKPCPPVLVPTGHWHPVQVATRQCYAYTTLPVRPVLQPVRPVLQCYTAS